MNVEHRCLHSSACSHWHSWPDGAPSRASKTMFQRSSNGLPSILPAYLGMCTLKTGDIDWDVDANPLHSSGVPLTIYLMPTKSSYLLESKYWVQYDLQTSSSNGTATSRRRWSI